MIKKLFTLFAVLAVSCLMCKASFAEDLTPELCKEKVLKAADLLMAEGDAALPKIEAEDGEFRFANGEGYVWVHNLEGIMLMHPIKPSLNGKQVMEITDSNGRFLFGAFNELVEESGQGWVAYMWPKPGSDEPEAKVSFVKLVESDDKNYVVGAGLNNLTEMDIKAKFPDDAIYEE